VWLEETAYEQAEEILLDKGADNVGLFLPYWIFNYFLSMI